MIDRDAKDWSSQEITKLHTQVYRTVDSEEAW